MPKPPTDAELAALLRSGRAKAEARDRDIRHLFAESRMLIADSQQLRAEMRQTVRLLRGQP